MHPPPPTSSPPPIPFAPFEPELHVGEWSIFVPVDYYQLVVPFMTQQYGDELTTQLALLVHTNTGCEYEDHSKWALWAGQKWQVQSLFPALLFAWGSLSPLPLPIHLLFTILFQLDMSIFNATIQTNEARCSLPFFSAAWL